MIWIELLGPSGIGKSYWYKMFMDRYPEYEPKRNVLNRIYTSNYYKESSFKIKFMFLIYKLNLYRVSNHFKHRLFSYFLDDFKRKSKNVFTQKDEKIIGKYFASMNTLKEPQIVKLNKASYFYQKLFEFKFYEAFLDDDDIYLAEDGLIHLSPVYMSYLQPSKMLIFQKDYQTIETQRINRAKKNPTTFIELLYNEEELKNYMCHYFKIYEMKINNLLENTNVKKFNIINLDNKNVLETMRSAIIETNKDGIS